VGASGKSNRCAKSLVVLAKNLSLPKYKCRMQERSKGNKIVKSLYYNGLMGPYLFNNMHSHMEIACGGREKKRRDFCLNNIPCTVVCTKLSGS
jgi:hypothetical protein